MKKLSLLIIMALVATAVAMAQAPYGADILGAHNGYGRGCVMCHAPHSGSAGNGVASNGTTIGMDPQNGMYALWGQDLTPLFGQSFEFSGDGSTNTTTGKYVVTLPAAGTITSAHDANTVILFCLSCHDGVLTKVGMMTGTTVEVLPVVGGHAPTLLAKAAPSGGAAYNNDHPVGMNAVVTCNGSSKGSPVTTAVESGYNWDCTGGGIGSTPITPGANQKIFMGNNLSSFWNSANNPLASFGVSGNTGYTVNAVTCTTCHNQHSMTRYTVNGNSFNTMFFIQGQYTPSAGGNSVAQFCRNCHGGESNEMNGLTGVPTI
jgi:hypothetical protein